MIINILALLFIILLYKFTTVDRVLLWIAIILCLLCIAGIDIGMIGAVVLIVVYKIAKTCLALYDKTNIDRSKEKKAARRPPYSER